MKTRFTAHIGGDFRTADGIRLTSFQLCRPLARPSMPLRIGTASACLTFEDGRITREHYGPELARRAPAIRRLARLTIAKLPAP